MLPSVPAKLTGKERHDNVSHFTPQNAWNESAEQEKQFGIRFVYNPTASHVVNISQTLIAFAGSSGSHFFGIGSAPFII